MTRRRIVLLGLVVGCLVFNAIYLPKMFKSPEEQGYEEIEAVYVAYMPELESKQRNNPNNSLYRGVHGGLDPDYPDLSHYVSGDDWSPYSVLGSVAVRCGFSGLSVRIYTLGMDETKIGDMPDRLFLPAASPAAVECVRAELPQGFVLERLEMPVTPSKVGWDVGELRFSRDPPQ